MFNGAEVIHWVRARVTRFGKISPLWQKFSEILWMVYYVFGKLLHLLLHFYATEKIAIIVNGQRLKK